MNNLNATDILLQTLDIILIEVGGSDCEYFKHTKDHNVPNLICDASSK